MGPSGDSSPTGVLEALGQLHMMSRERWRLCGLLDWLMVTNYIFGLECQREWMLWGSLTGRSSEFWGSVARVVGSGLGKV